MKKLLRKIMVLICIAVMFLMPTSCALAETSTPVLVINYDGRKYFDYQPDFVLDTFITTTLHDTTNPVGIAGHPWTVTSGKTFRIDIITVEQNCTLQVVVLNGAGYVIYNNVLTTNYGGVVVDLPITSDDSYYVWVTAYYSPVTIRGYGGYLL